MEYYRKSVGTVAVVGLFEYAGDSAQQSESETFETGHKVIEARAGRHRSNLLTPFFVRVVKNDSTDTVA